MTHRHKQAYWTAALLAALVGAALFFGFRQHPSPYDDAYITYRYARNIAWGRGFVYNPGESVLGTTTPLYTLLLAALALIWPNLPLVSHIVGILAWAMCALIVYAIGRMTSGRMVGLAAAAWIATNPLFRNVLGMETPLYICLALLAIYLQLRHKTGWAALCAGLTFLMRWDGILVVGILLFVVLLHDRKALLRACLICAAIIIPWLVYSYLTFGSIFPNSFYAKAGQGWNQELGGAEIGTFARGLLSLAKSAYAVNRLHVLVPVFALVGLIVVLRRRAGWWPLILWTVTYTAGYMVLGVLSFPWYATPLVPALALLVAEGVHAVVVWVSQHLGQNARYLLYAAVISIVCLAPNVDWMLKTQRTVIDAHSVTYLKIGQWLSENTPPNSSVAMIEIGLIGYYGDRTVVDTMGLVSPEMVGHLESWLQTLQFAVNHYWPDYVIGLERTAWAGIVHEPWFLEAYAPQAKIENPADGVAPATIYHRRNDMLRQKYAHRTGRKVWFGEEISLNQLQAAEASVSPGDRLHLRLDWQAETDVSTDYRSRFELQNISDGRAWALGRDIVPLNGGNPTHQWRSGDQVVDHPSLVVPDDVPSGTYVLQLIVSGQGGPVSIKTSDGPAEHVAVGPIQVGDALPAAKEPNYLLGATFADGIRLAGCDLGADAVDNVTVSLYWEASGDGLRDYTVFVHLLSEDDQLMAQHDGPPPLTTGLWVPDIKVVSRHDLSLPADLAPGVYSLRTGMYHWPDLERQAVLTANHLDSANDTLLIGYLVVEAEQVRFQGPHGSQ